ncbi:hypothetical protein SSX86_008823 [Deinandra increscens subsp. villosa]|uniref:PWWP domain-containing protein n=1 Tax=Deinandra increscens subsp. villosa TaxID=3103831 RepID=A0AAP0H4C7_9ASTR
METLKAPETVIEGLVASKQVETGNLIGGVSHSFDLGKGKCVESGFKPVVDSGGHGDGQMKGISLFVELIGGVTNKPDGESKRDIRDVGRKEFRVEVGDLVWVTIKKQKQSWWPGIVCDASDAPKDVAKWPIREDDCLVRCYGNGSYILCPVFEVKPFVGYFDRLPSQSQAKKFLDALDKAVVELGHRVKSEFSCSCFSKVKMEKAGSFSELSVNRFEPMVFLDYIKDLARDISIPNNIDYVVKQNCLSAFYRSLGHLQIPMHQLKLGSGSPSKMKTEEENQGFNEYFEKSEKPYETRERRKSRFLSYPGECGNEDSMVDDNEGVDLNKSNSQSLSVKKPRKKWSRKNKDVQVNLCSSELLSQVKFAAQDCLFPCESKSFDMVQRFISAFRKRAFNDFSNQVPIEMPNHQILQETLPKKVKRKKDKYVVSPPFRNDSTHDPLITEFKNVGSLNPEAQSMANNRTEMSANQNTFYNFADYPPACKTEPERLMKNEENITSMHPCNAGISTPPFVNGHMEGLYQSPVFYFTNEFGLAQPYFTGNHSEPQAGLVPACHMPKKRGRKKKNIDLQANPSSTIIPDFAGNHSEPMVGLVPAGLGHVPKKSWKKRKNIDLQVNPSSAIIPNLNENVTEKKREKKSKTKEVGVPCIDLSYNKVQQDSVEEVKGTAFLLKFSPDYPLPSIQDLYSVFSKYGALIESETQVLNENLSGQVVFLDSSSAGGAFWGLQNDKPFGPVLVNYKIQHLSDAESMVPFRTPIKSPSGFKPMDSQALMAPDSNTNATEIQIVKRSKTIEEIRLPSMDNHSYGKAHQSNGEVTGTALLLKFSENHPLPSFQDLNSVFCQYGELNEFETHVSGQNLTGQVVFVNPSSAGEAIQRLEKDRPFGQAISSYQLHHLYNVQPAIQVQSPPISPLKPITPLKMNPCQDLGVIKKNLEMMNSVLEKSGDSLSLEMRGKLESEIKGLMNKVSAMDGSSSSCYL